MIEKTKDFIKLYIKENFSFLLFLLVFLFIFNINTDYSIYKAGGSINISERINKKNDIKPAKGSFNMAYVGMIEGRLPFYLIAKLVPSWELVKNDEITYTDSETMKDSMKRDHLYYEESISNAKLVAYQKSGINYTIKEVHNYIIFFSEQSSVKAKIGDELLSYDDIDFSSIAILKEYIKTKQVGDEISLTLKRKDKEFKATSVVFEEKGHLLIGLSTITTKEIKSETEIIVDNKSSESGPSGGLILSLAIYDALTEVDITKGNKIIGTGVIELDGRVTEIGGVKHKLNGAVKKKADVFLVPSANYNEAIAYAKKHDYDIIIKGVSHFDEALKFIENLEEKK